MTRSWRFVAACALCAAALRVLGCGVDPATPDPLDGFDVAGLLTNYGHEVVYPTILSFDDALAGLTADVDAWGTALETTDGRTERLVAQTSWLETMAVWQQLEVMQVGVLGSSASVIGGEDLRDAVYSWPTVNACRVDQETLEEAWGSGSFFADELVNVQGLDAVEHMLWSEEGVSRCADGVQIIEGGDWAAAGVASVQALRADYTAALVAHIAVVTDSLLEDWDPERGDWGGVLASAGDGSSPYEDTGEALNEVFQALFYVELMVKDRKLAQPLGLQNCDEPTVCPEALESQFADAGYEHLRANMLAGLQVFRGGDGSGFDDLLTYVGRPELAATFLDALEAALDLLDTYEDTASARLASDADSLLALHDLVKAVTDVLKGDIAGELLLDIPADAASDTD